MYRLGSLVLTVDPTMSYRVFPIHTMTPIWVFPAYPLLIVAPLAGNYIRSARYRTDDMSIAMPFCAITVQLTGYLISLMIMAAFLYRLMTQKLPMDHQRPGVVGARAHIACTRQKV